ncbi:MAG TPA: hypothetical protein VMT27_04250 [Actinomycetes bacterium]|nr:hypothetical protein [Actinomycetes bacterium]
MPTVCLHIGAMKSGTSYLQHVLQRNREALLVAGVLFPGRRWRDQVDAAEELVGVLPEGKQAKVGAWQSLTDEVTAFNGHTAVISMETLSAADRAAAARAVSSFAPNRVRIVLTARDLGRGVPAQWQESVKNGVTLGFGKYLALISASPSRSLPGARAFWRPQDIGAILRTWQPHVAPEDLVVVTVPPAGAQRSVLWHRFCEAAGIDPQGVDDSVSTNESLGAVSAELLRRVNRAAKARDVSPEVAAVVKQRLAKQVLAARKASEPSLDVPEEYQPWLVQTAADLVADVKQVGPRVVGDLDELLVDGDASAASWSAKAMPWLSRRSGAQAASVSESDLLDAALDGLLGLSQQLADARAPGRPRRT